MECEVDVVFIPKYRRKALFWKLRPHLGKMFRELARGYWVSTVGRDEAAVRLYIQQQEQQDKRLDQLGPFGGKSRLERLQD